MPSIRVSAAVLSLFALANCSGGVETAAPGGVVGEFTVGIQSAPPSIEQGGTGTRTANIARTGGFSQSVQLTTESLPSGVTAAFSPPLITNSTTTTTLTVTVASSVAPGTYVFTVRGTASGLGDQTTNVAFSVTARPAIVFSVAVPTLAVAQGSSGAYATTLARTNCTGAVTVALSGAPAAVAITVGNTDDSYTMNATVPASVPVGSYTLTATASGTGVVAATASLTLVVTTAAAPSVAIVATPSAVAAAAGASVSTTVAITRTNFTGTVVVAVQSDLPAGVNALNTPGGPAIGNSVLVTFSVSASATPGLYPIVLEGSGFQAAAGTTTVTLTITAAVDGVVLSAGSSSLSIQQGA